MKKRSTLWLIGILFSVSGWGNELKPVHVLTAEQYNPEIKRHVETVEKEMFRANATRVRTQKSLDTLIKVATRRLRRSGFHDEANKINDDWEFTYKTQVTYPFMDLGDHDPLNTWLDTVYATLLLTLGPRIVTQLHLDDIWVFNYAIPVTFHPCEPDWDKEEYKKHFVPFTGSLTYWIAFLACTAGVAGADMSMMCSPLGSVAELAMVLTLAPRLSDRVYDRRCGQ